MNVVELWHRAEAAIGDAEAFEAAVEVLPLRLEWLARALWALDDGSTQAVRALVPQLVEAGEHDVAAVLDALLTPGTRPGQAALDAALLPLGDLLGVFEAARATDAEVEPSQALIDVARGRVVLGAVLQVLVGAFERVGRNPRVAHLLPRAEQIRVAAQLLALHGTVNNGTLAQAFETLLVDFSPERWPDLAVHPGVLLDWARAETPWTKLHTHALRAAARADDDTRRALLGAMLGRIQRSVDAGRLLELAAPVWAAGQLAEPLAEADPALADLVTQLRQLELRLRWIAEGEVPGELLESLWVHARVPPAERIELARALLANPPEDPDPRVIVESQLFLLARLPDAAEVAGVLEAGARGAPRAMLASGLAQLGASPARQRYVLGLHAAHQDEHADALQAATALVREHDDPSAAESLLEKVTTALLQRGARDDQPSARDDQRSARDDQPSALDPQVRAALDEAVAALGEAPRLSLELAPLLLASLRTLLGAVPQSLHPAVRRSLEGLGTTPRERGARITALSHLGDEDGAREELRAVGRSLRELEPVSAAEDHALETLAWMLFWGDPGDHEGVEALARPLSRFVQKEGAARAAAAAVRVAEAGGASVLHGVVQWYLLERARLGDDRRWIDLCCRLARVPDALEVYGVQLVRRALDTAPKTVEALDAAIRDELQALIGSGQSPEDYFAARRAD